MTPEESEPLLDARGEAFARLAAKMHAEGRIACCTHVFMIHACRPPGSGKWPPGQFLSSMARLRVTSMMPPSGLSA